MPNPEQMTAVERRLREILARHTAGLRRRSDGPDGLVLEARALGPNGRPVWFGAVRRGRSYVSYHLIPVYGNPSLLADVSPALRRRMQGKSCFNFTAVDEALFAELDELTRRGHAWYESAGYLEPGARVRRDGTVERPAT